ncbi:MAG: hypothetical protein AAGG38_06225 [Planctomycetota bacterium]
MNTTNANPRKPGVHRLNLKAAASANHVARKSLQAIEAKEKKRVLERLAIPADVNDAERLRGLSRRLREKGFDRRVYLNLQDWYDITACLEVVAGLLDDPDDGSLEP